MLAELLASEIKKKTSSLKTNVHKHRLLNFIEDLSKLKCFREADQN